jgi:hypothetical protein
MASAMMTLTGPLSAAKLQQRPLQLVFPQRATRLGDFDLWLPPDFSIIVVILRAFAYMNTGAVFMMGIVAVKPK